MSFTTRKRARAAGDKVVARRVMDIIKPTMVHRGIPRAPMQFKALRRPGLGVESGYLDIAAADYGLDTNGTVTLLNLVPIGTSVSQRVGKKIIMKGLQCRGHSYNQATATFSNNSIIIIYDHQPGTALPAVTDILVSATSLALNNDNNSRRFRMLKRDDFILSGVPGTAVGVGPAKLSTFYLDLKQLPVVYRSTAAGDVTDIETGALYLLTIGNNSAAGTTDATARLAFRLRYFEI